MATIVKSTVGLLIGDSIVNNFYRDALDLLRARGDAVYSIAVAGHKVGDQLQRFEDTPIIKGYLNIDWIFAQCGINNVINNFTVAQTESWMDLLITSMNRWAPAAIKIIGTILPARGWFNSHTPAHYQVWQDTNALYASKYSGYDVIQADLNDGSGFLRPEYATTDLLHPNIAGSRRIAALLQQKIITEFPNTTRLPYERDADSEGV